MTSIERELEKMSDLKVKENLELFNHFFNRHYIIELCNKRGKEVSIGQTQQVVGYLHKLLEKMPKPIKSYEKKELIEFLEGYEGYINSLTKQKVIRQNDSIVIESTKQKLSKETIKKQVSVIKTFLNYLCDNEIIDPNLMRELKKKHIFQISYINKPRYNHLTDINAKERDAIVFHNAKNVFEFAWKSLLRETGARSGEIKNLLIGMVFFHEKEGYAEVILNGKTGERKVPIINSAIPLRNWIEKHPDKENTQAFVFPSFVYDRINHKRIFKSDKQISSAYFSQRLKKTAEALEIKKFVRPHLFRHLKALEMKGKSLDTPTANELMGWSKNSDMFCHYGSGNPERMLDAVYQLAGIKRQEVIPEEEFKVCNNCKAINSAERLYCQTCNNSLGYAKPDTQIPKLVAINNRLDELEKLSQYAFATANRKIKEMGEDEYGLLLKNLETKRV